MFKLLSRLKISIMITPHNTFMVVLTNWSVGLVYLSIIFSFLIRDVPSNAYLFNIFPGVRLSPQLTLAIMLLAMVPWFILPKSFLILSICVIPLIGIVSVQSAFLIIGPQRPIWPIPLYYAYVAIVGVINLRYYLKHRR